MTFNLVDEPWIRVRRLNGEIDMVSIRTAMTEADDLRRLAGEIPTQDIAVLRLLIAICLRAAPSFESAEDAAEAWHEWWEDRRLPQEVMPYLAAWQHRFDLLDPDQPFYQVADLHTASGRTSGLAKLVAEVPDGYQFFTVRKTPQSLSLPEAARWLVHAMAFDPSGIKSGAVGDDRVKGGKGYPNGRAWAGWCAVTMAEGRTLLETLLLNLVLPATHDDDQPQWERHPLSASPHPTKVAPAGAVDTLTWPSRRIRLFTEGDSVIDALLCNGDRLDPQNQFEEPFTSWRYSEPQSKKAGGTVFMPSILTEGRAAWRGLEGILAMSTERASTPQRATALIEWLATLVRQGSLPPSYALRLRIGGLVYGSNDSVVSLSLDDEVAADVVALVDHDTAMTAVAAAADAEAAARALGDLAQTLAKAAGAEPDRATRARNNAKEAAYGLCDRPFRDWLLTLEPGQPLPERAAAWQTTLKDLTMTEGRRLVEMAGPAAYTGRIVTDSLSKTSRRVDAGQAWRWLRASLAKALPLTVPTKESA